MIFRRYINTLFERILQCMHTVMLYICYIQMYESNQTHVYTHIYIHIHINTQIRKNITKHFYGAALTFNLQQCNKQITNFLNSIDAQFTRHQYPELFQSGSVIAVTPGKKKKKKKRKAFLKVQKGNHMTIIKKIIKLNRK